MSVWDDANKYADYILEYWGDSSIEWRQKNRKILNQAIEVYNNYVFGKATLNEVKYAVVYAETMLKNDWGNYMKDIELMKKNVDEIELNKIAK